MQVPPFRYTRWILAVAALTPLPLRAAENPQTSDLPEFNLAPYEVKATPFLRQLDPFAAQNAPGNRLRQGRPADLAQSLADLFPEIGLVRKAGTANDVALRGLSGDDLSVTVDGRKVQHACSNRMDPPASQAATAEIETVALTVGAFDLRHSGSLGGALDIRTPQPDATESLRANASYASFEKRQASLSLTGGSPAFPAWASFSWMQSGQYEDARGRSLTEFPDSTQWRPDDYLPAYRDQDAYKAFHAATKLAFRQSPESEARFTASFRLREDADVLYPGLRMDADSTRTREAGLRYENPQTAFSVDFYHNWTDHDMRDTRRLSSRQNAMGMPRPQYVLDRGWYMESIADSSTTGLNAAFQPTIAQTQLALGFEATRRQWNIENRLGAGPPNADSSAEIRNDMIPETDVRIVGIYLQSETAFTEHWTLAAGLRLDRFRTAASDDTAFLQSQRGPAPNRTDTVWAATAALSRSFGQHTSVFTGIGSIARVPNGQERYMQLQRPGSMPNWLGNPNLQPPRNTEWSAGASYQNDRLQLEARVFHSWFHNRVYPGSLLPGDDPRLTKPTQSWFNIDARSYGGELRLTLRPTGFLHINASTSYQKGHKEDRPPNATNDQLAEMPPWQGRLAVRLFDSNRFLLLEARFADRQNEIDPDLAELTVPGYAVLDLRAGWSFHPHWRLAAGIANLLDRQYSVTNAQVRNPFASFARIPEPGRSAYLSLHCSF